MTEHYCGFRNPQLACYKVASLFLEVVPYSSAPVIVPACRQCFDRRFPMERGAQPSEILPVKGRSGRVYFERYVSHYTQVGEDEYLVCEVLDR